jgi:hypothetical protein
MQHDLDAVLVPTCPFHVVGLGKHSGLYWIWFKMVDSFSTVLKHIKQQAVTEFFMPKNETPTKIHQNYWIYMVKILWM